MDEGRGDQGVERGGKRALDTRTEERAYHKDIVGEYKHVAFCAHAKTTAQACAKARYRELETFTYTCIFTDSDDARRGDKRLRGK